MHYTTIITLIHQHCPETLLRSADKSAVVARNQAHLEHVLATLQAHTGQVFYATSEGRIYSQSDLKLITAYDLTKALYAQSDETLSALNQALTI